MIMQDQPVKVVLPLQMYSTNHRVKERPMMLVRYHRFQAIWFSFLKHEQLEMSIMSNYELAMKKHF